MGIPTHDFRESSKLKAAIRRLKRHIKKVEKKKGISMKPLEELIKQLQDNEIETADRKLIINQAIVVLEHFYCHLPFKCRRYAVDPVQRLKSLALRLDADEITSFEFHREMMKTSYEVRDLHTRYVPPHQFRTAVAFLPFMMGATGEPPDRRFFVRYVLEDASGEPFAGALDVPFKDGVEITHWNGVPVKDALDRFAETQPGTNRAARFARALLFMAVRPLLLSLPPEEYSVIIRYKDEDGKQSEVILPWWVCRGFGRDPMHFAKEHLSECIELAQGHEMRKHICMATGGKIEYREEALRLPRTKKNFGYIRIRNFDESINKDFVDELRKPLEELKRKGVASDGLILDLRGNPGGSIEAAERCLQLLTPKKITPAGFQMRITPKLRELFLAKQEENWLAPAVLESWASEIRDSVESGNLTSAHPLTSEHVANDVGQIYHGPVAIITDALTCSAAEIFAAGFEDHKIGVVAGVDDNTAGAGAGCLDDKEFCTRFDWYWKQQKEQTKQQMKSPLTKLPRGVKLAFAFWRSVRVGENAGQPLEDVGVRIMEPIRFEREDLFDREKKRFLFKVCRLLAKRPSFQLDIVKAVRKDHEVLVTVKTRNLERLECYLDDRQQKPVEPKEENRQIRITIPLSQTLPIPKRIEIKGYARLNEDGEGSVWMSKRGKPTLVAAARRTISKQ